MKIFKNIRHWFKVQGSSTSEAAKPSARFKRKPLTVRSTSGRLQPTGSKNPEPLTIQGIPDAPMTPEPDDAELAAAALLEHMCDVRGKREDVEGKHQPSALSPQPSERHQPSEIHDAKYFKDLAARIRQAQEAARLRTLRFLAFVEQELAKKELPLTGPGSLGLLEAELMKRLDVIERHGGELKTRWQHCVAQVMVRLYNVNVNGNDNGNDNGNGNCYDHELLEFHECL